MPRLREEVDRITLYIHLKHSEMVFCPLLYLEDCKIKLQENMDMYNAGEDYQCMPDKLNKKIALRQMSKCDSIAFHLLS